MFRTLPRLAVTVFVLATMATASPAAAEETGETTSARLSFAPLATAPSAAVRGAVLFPVPSTTASTEQARPIVPLRAPSRQFDGGGRPALLPALYAANVTLQALDAHSTMTALGRGAHEANPVMQGVAGNRTALLAVKAGAAAGTIYFAEKLWRRNRVGAVVMMAVVNGVTAAIVAHNYKVARELR